MKWLFLLLLVPTQLVLAQSKPAKVYSYVEQMPELPAGGGTAGIAMAILKRLKVTKAALEASEGRPAVYFEVTPTGQVQHVRMTRSSHSVGLDAALMGAVKSLPTFKPGYQSGHPVTVSFNIPIACIKPQ
jgi:protein TonB